MISVGLGISPTLHPILSSKFTLNLKNLPLMKRTIPICHWCKHYNDRISSEYPYEKVCVAFRREIPTEIWGGEYGSSFDHHFPHHEDNGIQFDKADYSELIKRSNFKNYSSQEAIENAFQYNANYVRLNHEANLNPPKPIKTIQTYIIPLDLLNAQFLRDRFEKWGFDLNLDDNKQFIPEETYTRIQDDLESYVAWLEKNFMDTKTPKDAATVFWNILSALKEGKYP